jgi:DNA replication protein DnaC
MDGIVLRSDEGWWPLGVTTEASLAESDDSGLHQRILAATRECWVRRHRHIFLAGPIGIGKTYLARAFGQKACRDGFTAYFATAAQLFRELELARADGRYAKKLRALGQLDALIVDDWAMAELNDSERRALLKICDARYQIKATLLASQLPVAKWHGQIGDPKVADSIPDRLVHAAHRLEMQGESLRKKKAGRNPQNGE